MKRYYKPSCKSDPALAASAIQVELRGLRGKAARMLKYLDGTYAIYYVPGIGYILTDESLDLDEARWQGPSLDCLIEWLELKYDDISNEIEEAKQ